LSQASSHARSDNISLAISAIVMAVFALSLGDALIKYLSADFTLAQIFVLRSALAIPVLVAVLMIRYRDVSLRPVSVGWTTARSLMLGVMWLAYYSALPHVEFSIAAAAFYTLPLFITLFAGLFLGEKVGMQGWVAVCLGFGGVLLILNPQADDFNVYGLLPLLSAVLYAFAMILTRSKCKGESPLVLAISMNVVMLGLGVALTALVWFWPPSAQAVDTYQFLFGPWVPMGAEQWLAMALLAAAIITGGVATAIAYQAGAPSIVATYDFAYLAFVAFWGILFFAEIPETTTIIGMVLIVTAGILAVRR